MIKLIDKWLCHIEDLLIVVLTVLGLGMATLQVILRYVFNTGIHWLEAGLVTALIWAMLFGAVRAVREGHHPRVDLIPHLVPPAARAALNAVALIATGALVLFFLSDAVFYARFLNMINALHPELGVLQLYPFLIVPIITALMAIRYAMIAWALFKSPDAMSPEGNFRMLMGEDVSAGDYHE